MHFMNKILCGDSLTTLKTIPDECVHCCVTSPPYWGLRDYGTSQFLGGDAECDHYEAIQLTAAAAVGTKGDPNKIKQQIAGKIGQWKSCPKCGAVRVDSQIGLEKTPEEYTEKLVEVFREVRRVLRGDATLWLNLGDSYNNAGSSRNGEGLDGSRRGGATGAEGELGYKNRDNRHALKSSGIKHKDLCGIPWRVAFALQADGWWLRQDIIWSKPAPMPESVTDRCTKSHEYIFLLSKSATYYYDQEAILEPCSHADEAKYDNGQNGHGGGESHEGQGSSTRKFRKAGNKSHKYVDEYESSDTEEHRTKAGLMQVADKTWEVRNKRSVWTVSTKPYKGAHFATFPPKLIAPCILAGCPVGGIVLDPFMGSGTTAYVAKHNGRNYLGCELNPDYIKLANKRLAQHVLDF